MNDGWIKIHRKIIDSAVFDDPRTLKVWLWCLLKASHRSRRIIFDGKELEIKEGQFIFGTRAASKELGIPRTTLHNRMVLLEKIGNLVRKAGRKFTIVEVVKWCEYQYKWDASGNKQECKNKRSSYRKVSSQCKYKGLFGGMYSSLATKDLKKCGCPRCAQDLAFRRKGANKAS